MKQFFLLYSFIFFLTLTAIGQKAEDYHKKASTFYDKKDYANAIVQINKALEIEPANATYLFFKGNACERADKLEEAFEAYTSAIEVNPADAFAYNQRGLLLLRIQEPEYAIRDFSTALNFEKADSVRISLLLNRGAAKINIRDFNGAYDDFSSALQLDTLNIGILNNLASVCDEVGKGDQTLPYLFKILSIDSTFTGAYVNIGFKYQNNGDFKSAVKYFNKVLELSRDEPLAYSNRAFCLYKLGNNKAALADINKSIKLYPGNSYAYRNRALIYLAEKDNMKACKDIEEALRLGFTKMYGEEVEQLKTQHCK